MTEDGAHWPPPRGGLRPSRVSSRPTWARVTAVRPATKAAATSVARFCPARPRPEFRRGAISSSSGSANPSAASSLTALTSLSMLNRRWPAGSAPLTASVTSGQALPGRSLRTSGSHWSRPGNRSARRDARRDAASLRNTSGSRARRPGLPPTRPRAFAARKPALVRSRIRLRSNSATAPSICSTRTPLGPDVSIGSASERKCAPFARRVSTTESKWESERARRSMRATISVSPRRTRARAAVS